MNQKHIKSEQVEDEQIDEEEPMDYVGEEGDGEGEGFNSEEEEEESSESEEEPVWTQNDERGFLRALSAIKSGDAKIYDSETKFYDESEATPSTSSSLRKAPKSTLNNGQASQRMTLRDYEVKLVTERGGRFSEDEDEEPKYDESNLENDERIRNEFKALFNANDDDDDDSEFLTKRVKTEEEKQKEEDDYYEWLKGNANLNVFDEDLNKLKKRWSTREGLEGDELFLRDYLLEKQYEVPNDVDAIDDGTLPTYEEIIEQEAEEERAEMFEHKYNFRFEEPDQDFIKQYPRTTNETLRVTKKKRKRTKNRKLSDRELLKKIMSEPMSDDEDNSGVHGGFKYRSVPANDYGLSTAEILMADDKQLNAWASVTRVVAYRSNEEEQRDIERFQRKAKNVSLKDKIFRELSPLPEPAETAPEENGIGKKKKKRKSTTKLAVEAKRSAKKAAGDVKLLGADRLRAYGVRTKRLKKQLNKKKMEERRQKKLEEAAANTANGKNIKKEPTPASTPAKVKKEPISGDWAKVKKEPAY